MYLVNSAQSAQLTELKLPTFSIDPLVIDFGGLTTV